jgi:hypothetical protein
MADYLDVEVAGHPLWLPLPLQGDVDVEAAREIAGLVDPADAERREVAAALLAGHARQVRAAALQAAEQGVETLLAWGLLPAPGVLEPGATALLRAHAFDPPATDDDLVKAVVDTNAERHGDVDVDELDTASGRALSVRWRPVVIEDGERLVEEQRAVLWFLPDDGVLVVLSLYVLDLVEGGRAAGPLHELAAGVRLSTVLADSDADRPE